MPIRWTTRQEQRLRNLLEDLYVRKNQSISVIATTLKIAQSTVYARLRRLGIPVTPSLKPGYRNKKRITVPTHSAILAELVGVLLGDGHISPTQVLVNLGSKESGYAAHVIDLLGRAFGIIPHTSKRAKGYHDVYIGSVDAVRFLKRMGLRSHKVREQVGIPRWIFKKTEYRVACLRGLFDTDGSIYRLKYGWQICLCNRSLPLLHDARYMLLMCGFHPSKISIYNLYISQKRDIIRFARVVHFANSPKQAKLKLACARVGTEVVKPGAL